MIDMLFINEVIGETYFQLCISYHWLVAALSMVGMVETMIGATSQQETKLSMYYIIRFICPSILCKL
mgnify:CR=1 FL=1